MKNHTVGQAQYDAMVAAFRIMPGAGGFAKAGLAANVSRKTAGVAWKIGWPKRGFRAVQELFHEEQQQARAKLAEDAGKKAADDAAMVRKTEGDVLRLDYKLASAGTGDLVRLFAAGQKLAEYAQLKVEQEVALGKEGKMTAREAVELRGKITIQFRDMVGAFRELMEAERLYLGEPTAHIRLDADKTAVALVRYAREMSEDEFAEACKSGYIPERLAQGDDAVN